MTAPSFVEPATEAGVPTPEPTETQVRSAYPPPIDDLLPRVREVVAATGEVPSRNEIMKKFRVGAPKANAVRDALLAETAPGTADGSELDLDVPGFLAPDLAPSLIKPDGHPGTPTPPAAVQPAGKPVRVWPVFLLALPAFVAIWSGWVGLGELTGFGVMRPFPGIADWVSLNTAITLPIGVETYAAYALRVWLSGQVPARARRFARVSALGSLGLGAAGQVAYHLLAAAHVTGAPWPITTVVACFPVSVLGMGAALAHLIRSERS